MPPQPVCLINVVGLTKRTLAAASGALARVREEFAIYPLEEPLPAVTCTAQATMLTGRSPAEHGIVGNGWYWRDLGEVRFWVQSNRLIQAPTLYRVAQEIATQRGETFTCAKLFWWFNQGAPVHYSVTPKPYYGADGSKVFAIHGSPMDLPARLEQELGNFPFHAFWGPMSGIESSLWIARATAWVLEHLRPRLTLAYIPHLDYDLQRYGPEPDVTARAVGELEQAVGVVLDACQKHGVRPVVVSEYGLVRVRRPVYINRELRRRGWLVTRDGPFGETIETFLSDAFAVVDHQVAHVYVREPRLVSEVAAFLAEVPGVATVLQGREQLRAHGLDHSRSGDIVVLSEPDAWFAYHYWLDEKRRPDFAPTVDIHRKPGYDPCELFFDPTIPFPKLRAFLRLLQRRLGFRALFDVVPTDASLVRGSHGLPAGEEQDRPLLAAPHGTASLEPRRLADVFAFVREALGLGA